jgi:thiamine phosphate synthase YjbQ (UPF0047 family)
MQQIIQIPTPAHNGLYDITRQLESIVAESGVKTGLANVYVQGATAGIMILFIFMYPLLKGECKITSVHLIF